MVPHRVAQRVAKLFFLVLPLFVFAGCPGPGPEKTTKKDPAEITLPGQGSALAFQQIERDLAKFDWGPAHNAECQGCLSAGDVTIRYTGMTKDIKADDGPAKLRIVALIQNYSNQVVTHTLSRTTFKANTKYLMWVHSRSDKKATWGFIELGPGYDPDPKPIGLLKYCDHATPSPTDDADFKNCGDPYNASTPSRLIKSAYASTNASPSISKSGWIACDPDCCTGTIEQQ